MERKHYVSSRKPKAPIVHAKMARTQATKVFDTFWRFAAERQSIFYRRLKGEPSPWTEDEILREYKFTNAYRASDRVSQYLIREVVSNGEQTPRELFFRTIMFKLFNRIETWELLRRRLGEIRLRTYRFKLYDEILTETIENKTPIYSPAYIMPACGRTLRSGRKHRNHLKLLEQMISGSVPEQLLDAKTMGKAFKILREYPMMGDFLAYQFVTDINYSVLTGFSEAEFVVAGPGAKDGISKCFADTGGLADDDVIRMAADSQEDQFERLGLEFQSLWGRPLQLIDCQNLFCEVGKYSRVAHPDIRGRSGRTRIKQRFRASEKPLTPWSTKDARPE